MPRCVECAWFPWKPGADVSTLPSQRCHPDLPARRWTLDGMAAEHECGWFKAQGASTVPQEVKTSGDSKRSGRRR